MGKLKAKHIAKLRKKARLMQNYKVRDSWGVFGFNNSFRENNFTEIRAVSEFMAMKRFLNLYYRNNKKLHRSHGADRRTTYEWGEIEVIDEYGYAVYYH